MRVKKVVFKKGFFPQKLSNTLSKHIKTCKVIKNKESLEVVTAKGRIRGQAGFSFQ